jgi:hypothetical protein
MKFYQMPQLRSRISSRVIDNEGEDYLYPASCFIFVNLPLEVKKVLQHVSWRHGGRVRNGCEDRLRNAL